MTALSTVTPIKPMNKAPVILFIASLAVSCQRSDVSDEHGHAHAEESPSLAYTLYSERTELFVEFKPLVVGQPTTFAAHFTQLGANFTAVDEGSVTLSLIVDEKGVRQTRDEPASPGIFRLALKPVAAGTGSLIFDIKTSRYTDRIVIDSVTVFPDRTSAENSPLRQSPDGGISFSKEQAWRIEFANKEIKPQTFHEVIKVSGELSARPSDEQVVSARSNGVVRWNHLAVPGASVKQGQQLFVLASGNVTEANTESAYREAKANFEKAEADLQRVEPLLDDRIISQKDYLQIKNQYDQARIQFEILSRNHTTEGQAVRSPMAGFIKQISVRSGEYVQAGQPLAVITNDLSLQLTAEVPARFASQLPFIAEADFKSLRNDSAYNTKQLSGRVVSYGKALTDNASLLPIYFSLTNDGTLIPGESVVVYLKSSPIQNAFVIPQNALIEEQGSYYVYVQMTGESFEKREVKLGAEDGTSVQITAGLKPGERVVTKGAYMIKLASQSGSVPAHGHEH